MARQGSLGHLAPLRQLLIDAAARGVAPALEAAVWREGQLWEVRSHEGPALRFDLASLTKPLASGLIALALVAEGKLALDEPLGQGGATLRQLLDHSAGYAPWLPLFGELSALPAEARRSSLRAKVEALFPDRRPGAAAVYSDLGFLVLGQALEARSGRPLDRLFAQRVANPLGLSLEFNDLLAAPPLPAAPTGTRRPRPPAPGQEAALAAFESLEVGPQSGAVDDDNAFALGGVAGHAGLFGTARAVALAGARFLEELEGAQRLGPAALAQEFVRPSGPVGADGGRRALAWDRAAPQGSSLGTRLGRGPSGAVGHLGFTGCSLWLDLDARVAIALCSNRVWLGRGNQLIRDFRPRFHDAVAEILGVA